MALNIVDRIDGEVRIRHVLASVSDKSGLDTFVKGLIEVNPEVKIYSTGGTVRAIGDALGGNAGRNLVRVSEYTGQPEMQGGLVKTLDFKIYLGLLSETYNDAHAGDLERVCGVAIDMVVVNLYPFRETVSQADVTPERARTNIDIGGPCMVRAAAKNFLRVASVTDPSDYPSILQETRSSGGSLSLETRFRLAAKAFNHTAQYDTAIAGYFGKCSVEEVKSCYTIVDGGSAGD